MVGQDGRGGARAGQDGSGGGRYQASVHTHKNSVVVCKQHIAVRRGGRAVAWLALRSLGGRIRRGGYY